MLVARAFLVSKYPSGFGLSMVRIWNAARNIFSDMLGFYDGEVRSNLPCLKSAETVFLLAAGTVSFKRSI